MTQPDRYLPDEAANAGSFAAWAATTEDEWRERLKADMSSHLETTQAGFGNIGADIGETIDNIVKGLLGWLTGGWSHEDSLQALEDQAAATAALSAAIQALQNSQKNISVGGEAEFIDFGLRDDAGSLGTDFDETYSGDGTGTWEIVDGQAAWVEENDKPRSSIAIFNAETTATDYQLVGATFASAPEHFNAIAEGRNLLIARANSDGTSYVYADLGKYDVEIGCVVSGTKTVWDTFGSPILPFLSPFRFKANTVYWLQAGTEDGARIFQVLEESTPILTHTEVGTTSQLGESYRYTGFGVSAYATIFGTSAPGKVSAWAFSDNNIPDVVGSGAVMFRASGSNVAIASGTNDLPSNFFDDTDDVTADIDASLSNGRFTVDLPGWYRVKVRIKVADGEFPAFPQHLSLILKKNGSEHSRMGGDWGLYSANPEFDVVDDGMGGYTAELDEETGAYAPQAVFGEADVYLDTDDYVSIAYEASSSDGHFEGAAGGSQTRLSITLTSRSLA